MKKILSIALTLVMILSLFAGMQVSAFAADEQSDLAYVRKTANW